MQLRMSLPISARLCSLRIVQPMANTGWMSGGCLPLGRRGQILGPQKGWQKACEAWPVASNSFPKGKEDGCGCGQTSSDSASTGNGGMGIQLAKRMRNMSDAAEAFPFIAIEAEVPPAMVTPCQKFDTYLAYNYAMLMWNVNMHRALKISFALSDDHGRHPNGVSTWRFNFAWDPAKDFFSEVLYFTAKTKVMKSCIRSAAISQGCDFSILFYLFGSWSMVSSLAHWSKRLRSSLGAQYLKHIRDAFIFVVHRRPSQRLTWYFGKPESII